MTYVRHSLGHCGRSCARWSMFELSQDGRRCLRCGRHSVACPSSPGSCSLRCPGAWTPCRPSPRHSPHPSYAVEVRDHAEVFGSDAERRAREALQRIHRLHRTSVHIETIKSLDGAWIADVAGRRARMGNSEHLYILVAGGERDVGIIAARRGPASRLTDQERGSIRRAFLGPLQAGEADEALERGVRAIGTTLDSAAASGRKSAAGMP